MKVCHTPRSTPCINQAEAYTCMHTHTHTHTYASRCVYKHAQTHTDAQTHMQACSHLVLRLVLRLRKARNGDVTPICPSDRKVRIQFVTCMNTISCNVLLHNNTHHTRVTHERFKVGVAVRPLHSFSPFSYTPAFDGES
jgi:hypothetical protein